MVLGGSSSGATPGGNVYATHVTASGTSSSGTAGTAVASITAAAGRRLVGGVLGFVHQASGAGNSFTRVTLTLADDTTVTADPPTMAFTFAIMVAGIVQVATTTSVTAWSGAVAQGIKSVAVTTLNTGTGVRTAALSAMEVAA